MSDPPEVQWEEEIPAEPPDDRGGRSEVPDDQPLGAPADLDADEAPLPGLPESEPPSSG